MEYIMKYITVALLLSLVFAGTACENTGNNVSQEEVSLSSLSKTPEITTEEDTFFSQLFIRKNIPRDIKRPDSKVKNLSKKAIPASQIVTETGPEFDSKNIMDIITKAPIPSNTTLMVSIYDYETGAKISFNGSKKIHPASVKKNLYVLMFLEEVKMGNRFLDEEYTIKQEDKYGSPGSKVGGAGILQGAKVGAVYTWEELLSLMIIRSDNVATNIFIENLGPSAINYRAAEYGLENTYIEGKLYQDPIANSYSNADDMNQVLIALHSRQFIDGNLYDLALEIMNNTPRNRIAKYPPKGVVVARKGGTLTHTVGDSALVFYPDREPMALTIFVVGNDTGGGHAAVARSQGEAAIENLSKGIMEYFQ